MKGALSDDRQALLAAFYWPGRQFAAVWPLPRDLEDSLSLVRAAPKGRRRRRKEPRRLADVDRPIFSRAQQKSGALIVNTDSFAFLLAADTETGPGEQV